MFVEQTKQETDNQQMARITTHKNPHTYSRRCDNFKSKNNRTLFIYETFTLYYY
jgi:hypothetical protein